LIKRRWKVLTAGQGILENLLKAQKFENGQIDRGMKAEPTLVRAEGRVELDAESAVDLDFALVVFPDDAELDDALGDGGNLESCLVFWVLFKESRVLKSGGEFWETPSVSGFAIKTVQKLGVANH
jgi:hypothetical protein